MNSKHRRTLAAVFADPISANIKWRDIEAMLRALGATIEEGKGSRVHILLEGKPATFHRPHPNPDTDKGAVKAMRRFLTETGKTPAAETAKDSSLVDSVLFAQELESKQEMEKQREKRTTDRKKSGSEPTQD